VIALNADVSTGQRDDNEYIVLTNPQGVEFFTERPDRTSRRVRVLSLLMDLMPSILK
jgi:hypothetical protein